MPASKRIPVLEGAGFIMGGSVFLPIIYVLILKNLGHAYQVLKQRKPCLLSLARAKLGEVNPGKSGFP